MTPTATRFFLVPAGVDWTDGELAIHDILGVARAVDPSWVRAFEVSASEAMAFSKRRRAEIDADVDRQIRAREAARQEALRALHAAGASVQAALKDVDLEGARHLVERMGLDVARLEADPEAASALFAAFVATALQHLTPDAEGDRLAPLRAVLVQHGHPEAAEKLDQAADGILEWVSKLAD